VKRRGRILAEIGDRGARVFWRAGEGYSVREGGREGGKGRKAHKEQSTKAHSS